MDRRACEVLDGLGAGAKAMSGVGESQAEETPESISSSAVLSLNTNQYFCRRAPEDIDTRGCINY